MAFIPVKSKVGEWVTLTKDHRACNGVFEAGTRVRITAETIHGYNIEDEEGNCMYECGYDL